MMFRCAQSHMYMKHRGKPPTTGFKHPTQEMFAMMMMIMIVEEMYVGVNVNDGMQLKLLLLLWEWGGDR